jgi:SET domain-containing protein
MEQMHKKIIVKKSTIHGFGLFSTSIIKKGERIGVFEGVEVKENDEHVLWIYKKKWIGYKIINDLKYVNHSKTPNSEVHGLTLYALKNIECGHEITIDYGEEFE